MGDLLLGRTGAAFVPVALRTSWFLFFPVAGESGSRIVAACSPFLSRSPISVSIGIRLKLWISIDPWSESAPSSPKDEGRLSCLFSDPVASSHSDLAAYSSSVLLWHTFCNVD